MRVLLVLFSPCLPRCPAAGSRPEPPASRGRAGAPRFADTDPHDWVGVTPWQYPVHGIDVSKYQGDIDWHRVRASGVGFAFIKATEGGDHADDRFAAELGGRPRRRHAARRLPLLLLLPHRRRAGGLVHEPRAEGSRRAAAGARPRMEPQVADLPRYRPDPATVRREARSFLQALTVYYGKRPVDLHHRRLLPRQRALAARRLPLLAALGRRPPSERLPRPALGLLAVHRHRPRRRHRRPDRPQRLRRHPRRNGPASPAPAEAARSGSGPAEIPRSPPRSAGSGRWKPARNRQQ